MRRRRFLRAARGRVRAAGALRGTLPWARHGRRPGALGRPGEPSWPDQAAWKALPDIRSRGQLIRVEPPLQGGAVSPELLTQLGEPVLRGDRGVGDPETGWAGAGRRARACTRSRPGPAVDVSAVVRFAVRDRLRLVVKGGGHSDQGTSNAPGVRSLVWARPMDAHRRSTRLPFRRGVPGRSSQFRAVKRRRGRVVDAPYDAVTSRGGPRRAGRRWRDGRSGRPRPERRIGKLLERYGRRRRACSRQTWGLPTENRHR